MAAQNKDKMNILFLSFQNKNLAAKNRPTPWYQE